MGQMIDIRPFLGTSDKSWASQTPKKTVTHLANDRTRRLDTPICPSTGTVWSKMPRMTKVQDAAWKKFPHKNHFGKNKKWKESLCYCNVKGQSQNWFLIIRHFSDQACVPHKASRYETPKQGTGRGVSPGVRPSDYLRPWRTQAPVKCTDDKWDGRKEGSCGREATVLSWTEHEHLYSWGI